LASWNTVLLEKLIVTQLVKSSPLYFMEPESSLPCSQEPSTGTYPDSDESTVTLTSCFF